MTTKIFWDSEFTGLHKDTTLISIGLVADSGESFYAELTDYNKEQVDDWIQENVINNLIYEKVTNFHAVLDDNPKHYRVKTTKKALAAHITRWINQFEKVHLWGDVISYDFVLFCDIFGHAFNIPKNIYYVPFDISTAMEQAGIDPDVNREEFGQFSAPTDLKKHNALYDAYLIKQCYAMIQIIKLK